MQFKEFLQTYTENMVRADSFQKWRDELEQKGWQRAGQGSYGLVFSHPNKNYVLKLYDDDAGYNTFLDFLETQQGNPNVVMMKRRIYRARWKHHGVEIVALENLKPLSRGTNGTNGLFPVINDMVIFFNTAYRGLSLPSFEEVLAKINDRCLTEYNGNLLDVQDEKDLTSKRIAKSQKQNLKALRILITKYRPLIQTIYELKKFAKTHGKLGGLDLHKGNFMIRPSTGQIVITDPLA